MAARKLWGSLLIALALLTLAPPSHAQQACQGRRAVDPRSARLQVLEIHVAREAVAGRVRNTASETALGAAVWVNFYLSRRGGFAGQQCIAIGDLGPGEERDFLAPVQVDASRLEAWDYAGEVAGWR